MAIGNAEKEEKEEKITTIKKKSTSLLPSLSKYAS
jgi:hypothetical protein